MTKNIKWRPGNILEIRLEDDSFSYAVVVNEPLIAFTVPTYANRQDVSELLIRGNLIFQIWVMSNSIGNSGWPIVGSLSLDSLNLEQQTFYKFDTLSKKYHHYVDGVNDTPVTMEECIGLECAAVWNKEHVEDRLLSLKNGVSCKWHESLKAESRT